MLDRTSGGKSEELHARIRALQTQVQEAERMNSRLMQDLEAREKEVVRAKRLSGVVGPRGQASRDDLLRSEKDALNAAAELEALEIEMETLKRKCEVAERKAERVAMLESRVDELEDLVRERDEQLKQASAHVKTMGQQQEQQEELKRLREEVQMRDENGMRQLAERQDFLAEIAQGGSAVLKRDMEVMASELSVASGQKSNNGNKNTLVKSREALWSLIALMYARDAANVKKDLAQWQMMVKKLGEDKEIAEEKMQEASSSSVAASGVAAFESSVEEEKRRARELEEARKSIEALRMRTLEAEATRQQVKVVIAENERLRTDLAEKKKGYETSKRQLLEMEIELEVWKERVVQCRSELEQLKSNK